MQISQLKKIGSIIVLLCVVTLANNVHAVVPEVGGSYFTKHNLKYEKGRHITTNYARGDLLPVNSQVQVKSIRGDKMVLSYNGQDITIDNVEKHSKKSIQEVADLLLSTTQVNAGGQFAKDIKFGEVRLGMTKSEVIMARGYPPAHKTMSTEMDRWTYWSSRFVQITYVFENDRLVEGRGLR